MLKVITYPSGGYSVFDFESNEYKNGEEVNYYIGNYHMVNGSNNGNLMEIPSADVVNDILMRKGPGCRVKRITSYTGNRTVGKRMVYNYNSSGKIMFGMKHLNFDNFDFNNASYKLTSHSMYANASSAAGSPIGYDKVQEFSYDEANLANGYKEYSFENEVESNTSLFTYTMNSCDDMRWKYSSDHGVPYITYCNVGLPFIQRRDLAPIAIPNITHASNGNLLKYSVYDKSNRLKYQKTNIYEEKDIERLKYAANHPASGNYDKFTLLFSERAVFKTLKQSKIVEDGIETTTDYSYDPYFRHYKTSSISNSTSKGDEVITLYRYFSDFDYSTSSDEISEGVRTLSNKHVFSPIEIIRKRRTNGVANVVQADLYSYSASNSKLKGVFSAIIDSPLPEGTFMPSYVNQSGYFLKDVKYDLRKYVKGFNMIGQPTGITSSQIYDEAYIYDETTSETLAEVKNSSMENVAYSGFETESKGNWSYDLSHIIQGGYHGKRSYLLGNSTVLQHGGLNSNLLYTVTYWIRGHTPISVTGTQVGYPTPGKIDGEWTYFEHKLLGNTSITISGDGQVDELRLFPTNSTMNTYNYDHLVGISVQTDANGRNYYFDYDELNRLSGIRDNDKNFLKRISYNYSPQSAQPQYYFNNALESRFFRNNCENGQIAGSVVYRIPEYSYISTISQVDADEQANQELQANGQIYANTNAVCQEQTPPATTVDFEVNNPNTISFFASFKNLSTGILYNFTFGPGITSPGSMPVGVYDINITPSSGSTIFEWFIGDYQAPAAASLVAYGVSMNGNGYIYIGPY